MQEENWKPILGYEGLYEVSDQGRVKSLKRTRIGKGFCVAEVAERILKFTTQRGYRYVILCRESKIRKFLIHRLVAITFLGDIKGKLVVDHCNRIRDDNRLCNLRYVTMSVNVRNSNGKDSCGSIGVTYAKRYNIWHARFYYNKKSIHIGNFKTQSEAVTARKKYLAERGIHE